MMNIDKFMIRSLIIGLCGLLVASTSWAQTTLLEESFETDGNPARYTTSVPEFSDNANDFFTRTDGSNISGGYVVTGANGSFYFAAQDIDGEGAAPQQTLTFSNIDITGATNLQFSALFAEDDDGSNEDWDDTSDDNFVRVEYQIDGGGFQNLLAIEGSNAGSTNGAPRIDTNFDGVGDGTEITSAFASFMAAIAGTGSSLDIRFTINLEDGDEDIAIDLIRVTGTTGGGAVTPEVTVMASPMQVNEDAGVNTLTYTFTASATPTSDLTVNFAVSGTATFNEDYFYVSGANTFNASTGTLTIPSGQTSATVVLQVNRDAIAENDETVVLTVTGP